MAETLPGGFKYDVAFSFLSQDEGLASALNDQLQDRAKTFIYFDRQKEVAFTDGEETFGRVFREETRLVVVLYRAGWGESKWTRIEQAAIRARGFEHGYNFAKFIPLDVPPTVPRWLPPTHIYADLNRFGLDGAAAVIEQRIRELGGQVHQETVEEHAQRVERKLAFEKRRAKFRREPGVQESGVQYAQLWRAIEKRAAGVRASTSIDLRVIESLGGRWLVGLDRALTTKWLVKYSNSLDDSRLELRLFSDAPHQRDPWLSEKPTTVTAMQFSFDLLPTDEPGWIATNARKRAFSTEDLAEYLVRFYLEHGRAT